MAWRGTESVDPLWLGRALRSVKVLGLREALKCTEALGPIGALVL